MGKMGKFEIRNFLQLLRPPNLFTVPGDPLCGALLASHGAWSWRMLPCVIVSLAAYCAGLVINDLADFSEDLRERPARPLPSGGVSRRAALALAAGFIAIALAAAVCVSWVVVVVTLLLLLEILWYNLNAKKSAMWAPLAMGLCRGLSVLVGTVAFVPSFHTSPPPWVFGASGAITLYIAAVTALARTETSNPRIPPLIGSLIRGLLFLQAVFCFAAGGSGWVGTLILLALWPISRLVASHFYAS